MTIADATYETYSRFAKQLEGRLKEKDVATIACPVCTNKDWEVVGGTIPNRIGSWENRQTMGTFRTIPVGCTHCGYIMNFSARLYDLEG